MKRAVRTGTTPDQIIATIIEQDTILRAQGVTTTVQWVKGHSVSVGNNCADLLAGFGCEASIDGAPDGTLFENPNSRRLEAKVKTMAARQKLLGKCHKQALYTEWEQQYRQQERLEDEPQGLRRSQRLAALNALAPVASEAVTHKTPAGIWCNKLDSSRLDHVVKNTLTPRMDAGLRRQRKEQWRQWLAQGSHAIAGLEY